MAGSGRSHSWPVPYVRSLDGEYMPGQTVFVKGFMLGPVFEVNLTSGTNVRGDVARDPVGLHLSIRADENKIVVNSYDQNQWGKEEVHKNSIKEDEEFDIRIRAHQEHFEVFVNGKAQFIFNYRLPLTRLNHVYVDGAVELYHVSWEGRYYPMPYQTKIPGITAGQAVYVSGLVEDKAKGFAINLLKDNEHIFHFNPRFNENKVVRNTMQNGEWGPEELEGDFPFKKARTFDVIIGCTDSGYDVFVDGKPFCTFTHRIPASEIDYLTIEGDIVIQGIHW